MTTSITPHAHSEPREATDGATVAPRRTSVRASGVALAVTRVLLGFIFMWAFLDKTFGLGFATPHGQAWANGGSPTRGFLLGVDGPFSAVFAAMAGHAWVDVAFMGGMLLVGIALVLGVALIPAAVGATLLMGSLYLASLPLAHNPFVDEHLIYAATAVALATTQAGRHFGLGSWWARQALPARHTWLV